MDTLHNFCNLKVSRGFWKPPSDWRHQKKVTAKITESSKVWKVLLVTHTKNFVDVSNRLIFKVVIQLLMRLSWHCSSMWIISLDPGCCSPRISGNLEISVYYTNLHEACQRLPYERCLPQVRLCVDDDKGAKKALSSLLAGVVHAFVHSS